MDRTYSADDWDYEEVSVVTVRCCIAKCPWTKHVGWHDYDNGPEGAYAEHWRVVHANPRS